MTDPKQRPTFPWWIILCLVGLDYFSSIAYLPSIAIAQARALADFLALPGQDEASLRVLAPIAALGVVVLTLFAVLPVYLYVVGRSPHGEGGVGMLEERWAGWTGKLAVLVLLGFVATDYVLTRSLSTSNAADHIQQGPLFQQPPDAVRSGVAAVRNALPSPAREWTAQPRNERIMISVFLAILSFGLYHYLVRRMNHGFLGVAVTVVLLYLAVNAVVIGHGLAYIWYDPTLLLDWERSLRPTVGDVRHLSGGGLAFVVLLALVMFPPMAIGLSGFELTLASAPLVRGSERDDPQRPRWRIFNARLMMIAAAVIMCVLVLASVFVVTLLVPDEAIFQKNGTVHHRSLSYLAHGGVLKDRPGEELSSWFGAAFGTLYDGSTVLILILAGASVTIGMREIVPTFLSRFGMQLSWARQIGVITHLFNGLILVVTVVFKANVNHLMWAYAASVLALLFGAALAAMLDIRSRWRRPALGGAAAAPFAVIATLFGLMGLVVMVRGPAGVLIASGFIVVVLLTAITSRWLQSTEPRFEQWEFADEESERRFRAVSEHDFQVLVPHVDEHQTLAEKEENIRRAHRLLGEVPILFVQVEMGDPSDYHFKPLLTMTQVDGHEVIRISRATSIPHALAAVALACHDVGRPPEMYFTWPEGSTLAAMLNFVLLGRGNIPAQVREILRKAEPDATKRPRVVVG